MEQVQVLLEVNTENFIVLGYLPGEVTDIQWRFVVLCSPGTVVSQQSEHQWTEHTVLRASVVLLVMLIPVKKCKKCKKGLSTGAPQGCVLSPLLFILLTHDGATT